MWIYLAIGFAVGAVSVGAIMVAFRRRALKPGELQLPETPPRWMFWRRHR